METRKGEPSEQQWGNIRNIEQAAIEERTIDEGEWETKEQQQQWAGQGQSQQLKSYATITTDTQP